MLKQHWKIILSKNNDNSTPAMSIIEDLPGYKSTHVDIMLATIYDGEQVRDKDVIHVDGGIEDDVAWQDRYERIIAYLLNHYDSPGSPVGRSCVKTLAAEINRVLERKWNGDMALCFLAAMLQYSPYVCVASNVRARIK